MKRAFGAGHLPILCRNHDAPQGRSGTAWGRGRRWSFRL